MDPFRIITSTNMKDHPVARFLGELDADVRHVTLRRADFLLADRFGIRYLTADKFVEGVKNRSIYRDILEMKREYPDPVLIVQGEDPLHHPALSLTAAQGAILFISVVNRVPILVTANDAETAQMLFMMAAQTYGKTELQTGVGKKGPHTEPDAGSNGNGDPRVSILTLLPDVGPALAQGLLKHFGSLSRLFAAKAADLRKVEGIGPKRAEKIFAFLNKNRAA